MDLANFIQVSDHKDVHVASLQIETKILLSVANRSSSWSTGTADQSAIGTFGSCAFLVAAAAVDESLRCLDCQ